MDHTRGDPSLTGQSSIALLQERFKKLQRMREIRQERDLLSLSQQQSHSQHHHRRYQPAFNHTYNNNTTTTSGGGGSGGGGSGGGGGGGGGGGSFQSSSSSSSRRPPSSNSAHHLSLSLSPDSSMMKMPPPAEYFRVRETAGEAPSKPWLFGASLGYNSSSFNLDDTSSDVDTSLHL